MDTFKNRVRDMWVTEKMYFQTPNSTAPATILDRMDLKIMELVCDINSTQSCLVGSTFPREFHVKCRDG